jgi:hypothetical protein
MPSFNSITSRSKFLIYHISARSFNQLCFRSIHSDALGGVLEAKVSFSFLPFDALSLVLFLIIRVDEKFSRSLASQKPALVR